MVRHTTISFSECDSTYFLFTTEKRKNVTLLSFVRNWTHKILQPRNQVGNIAHDVKHLKRINLESEIAAPMDISSDSGFSYQDEVTKEYSNAQHQAILGHSLPICDRTTTKEDVLSSD
jgi:hypothetical protein